jgi:hypothetical protein
VNQHALDVTRGFLEVSSFDAVLAERGFLAMGRQIVDATVIEAQRPRLAKEEKAVLRNGGPAAGWSKAGSVDRLRRPLVHEAQPQGYAA